MNLRLGAAFFVSFAVLNADTLVLRNGNRFDGSFLSGDNRSLRFASGNQVNTYSLNDVTSVSFNNSAADAAPPPPARQAQPNAVPAGPPPQQAQEDPSPSDDNAPAPPAANTAGMQVASGTTITVRLIDPVNSETDRLGQTYRASTDSPVVVNGQTVIARGADAVATLIDAQKSGRIQGRTVMTLDLKSVTVNGRPYDITTTGVPQASSSRSARSAKVIGGTAALGAIIGAIAGGGKGAAIGTVAGAGAGTAAEVATSGQKVNIPAETRLTFTLQNPLNL
jgi:hypothetical protein